MTTTTVTLRPRYIDPSGNQSKEWLRGFWPNEGGWCGFEEKLNHVSRGDLYSNELFCFMVNDARSMIEFA